MDHAVVFAAFIALYVGHHVGDYWVQTDHQAQHKGNPGLEGSIACLEHVCTYMITQAVFLIGVLVWMGLGSDHELGSVVGLLLALLVSGATHYAADRREHGLMFRLARLLPGKDRFLRLGVPRDPRVIEAWFDCPSCEGRGTGGQAADESTNGGCWDCRGGGKLPSALTIDDNPQLATGAWALDQSWHITLGVLLPALIIGSFW
jgi:hypothetical protein